MSLYNIIRIDLKKEKIKAQKEEATLKNDWNHLQMVIVFKG